MNKQDITEITNKYWNDWSFNSSDGGCVITEGVFDEMVESLVKKSSALHNVRLSSDKELIEAARYGYEYHVDTSFPEKNFDDNCLNNVRQWLQAKKEINDET